jgi:DNA-binding HxlR family transcriptional regulator
MDTREKGIVMTDPGEMKYSLSNVVDILSMIARADRLYILFSLRSGRHSVSDLTRIVHGDSDGNHPSQTSAALAPLRRLCLVNHIRDGKHVFYELTDLGRQVIDCVCSIHQYKVSHGTQECSD